MNCLKQIAQEHNLSMNQIEFPILLDRLDPLSDCRAKFNYPKYGRCVNEFKADLLEKMTSSTADIVSADKNKTTTITDDAPDGDGNEDNIVDGKLIYFCGNSLGLQPNNVKTFVNTALDEWADLGVLNYHHGSNPASFSDRGLSEELAKWILNCEPDECVVTNGLSVNIHILLAKFYKPDRNSGRMYILVEDKIFPSDLYVIQSQLSWHGLDPNVHLIRMKSDEKGYLSLERIRSYIQQYKEQIALIWLPGVQHATGQLFNIESITKLAHNEAGCLIGWDLAHAVGNVTLNLHTWEVDFATWCSYKYLNSGPGAIGGLFVHQKHHHHDHDRHDAEIENGTEHKQIWSEGPQLLGWWSIDIRTRFEMNRTLELERGARAYCISNPSVLLTASLRASLDVIKSCSGMEQIRKKSIMLTAYLEYLLFHNLELETDENGNSDFVKHCELITPTDPDERGAQLTVRCVGIKSEDEDTSELILREMIMNGLICDLRERNMFRIAPAPMYNSFEEVFEFVRLFKKIISKFVHSN